MALEWKQNLATGVEEIDNQHKELFGKVNNLLDACNQQKGKDEVGKVVKFLEDYVITHFGAEEKMMKKTAYPGYSLHKQQHDQFIKDFLILKDNFEKEGATTHFVINVNHKVVDWLIKHVGNTDKALGAFLLAKK